MALSEATITRRAAMHRLVSDVICTGLVPVAGVDEVGAGALAGPVVATAVQLLPPASAACLSTLDLDDSKKLSRKKRQRIYDDLMCMPEIEVSIGMVSAREVDEINVLQARLKAMSLAVNGLQTSIPRTLFVDGNRPLDDLNQDIEQRVLIAADSKVSLVAAASIIAKVKRDLIMVKHATHFPQYAFDRHMGYATKTHLDALRDHGPCDIHRLSYKPVAVASDRYGLQSLAKEEI